MRINDFNNRRRNASKFSKKEFRGISTLISILILFGEKYEAYKFFSFNKRKVPVRKCKCRF